MAIGLVNASQQYLQDDAAPVTGPPFSVVAIAQCATLTTTQAVLWIGDKDVGNDYWTLEFGGAAGGDPIRWVATESAISSDSAGTAAGYSVDTWHVLGATEAAAADRRVYLDGGSKGTGTGSISPSGADRITLGAYGDSTPLAARYLDGKLYSVAIWGAELTDDEHAAAGRWVSPLAIRPEELLRWWLLWDADYYVDLVSGQTLTAFGAPSVDAGDPVGSLSGPRLLWPRVAPVADGRRVSASRRLKIAVAAGDKLRLRAQRTVGDRDLKTLADATGMSAVLEPSS